MGKKYLIDTNILIYYLANQIPADKLPFIEQVLENSFAISVISEIELLSFPNLSETAEQQIQTFLEGAHIFPLDNSTVKESITIRKKHKIKLADAIIGATASLQNRTLLTRNTRDFSKIEDLEIENPID